MRHVVVVAGCLGMLCLIERPLTLSTVLDADTNCHDCGPAGLGFVPSGYYDIGFEDGMFTSQERAAIVSGASGYWNGVYGSVGANVSVGGAETTYDVAPIKFYVDPGLAGQSVVAVAQISGDGTGSVGVNPDYLNNARSQTYWQWTGAHEVGHLFGFYNVYDTPRGSCFGKSIMYHAIYSNIGDWPSSSFCSDLAVNSALHAPGGYNPCDFGCPSGYRESCVGDQQPDPSNCNCCINYTPILIDLAGDGISMSDPQGGVVFQINDAGSRLRVGWPQAWDDVWLGFDRNANGRIDHGGELFGNTTRKRRGGFAEHGYDALADLDDNADSWIDGQDPFFERLVVWFDANRNGIGEQDEVRSLADVGIRRIGVQYRESRRQDEWGNKFRYIGRVQTAGGVRRSVDVFPAAEPVRTGLMGGRFQSACKMAAVRWAPEWLWFTLKVRSS